MREEELMVMADSTLMALCLEDGHTVVDSEGVIHVDNAHPPKLDVIKAYVRNQPTHEGRAPVVKKSDPALVQRLLEMAPSISSTQSEEADQSQIAEKLTALCQAAVNAKASDIHIEVVRKKRAFYCESMGNVGSLISWPMEKARVCKAIRWVSNWPVMHCR